MRILVLTTSYPASRSDASGIFIRYLAEALTRRGHSLRVVVPEGAGHAGSGQVASVPVWRFAYSLGSGPPALTGTPGGIPEAMRRHRSVLWQLPVMMASFVRAAFRHAGWADVIHANWLGAGLAGSAVRACTGLPMVITVRGDDAYLVRDRLPWRLAGRWVFRHCSAVTAVSANMADLIDPHVPPRARPVVVPTFGVDTELFHPPAAARPAGKPTGLFVGNVSRAKGVDVLLAALAQCDTHWRRFQIVGDGPDSQQLQDRAAKFGLGGRIEWAGHATPDEVALRMRQADFLVLPSLSEGRPNVVMEAMASGVAVIASAVGGVGELVRRGVTGLLVPPGDAGQLAQALTRVCRRPDLRSKLAAKAREHIERNDLTWERTAREFEGIFERATGAGS